VRQSTPPPSYPTLLLLLCNLAACWPSLRTCSTKKKKERKERTQSEVAPSPHLTQSGLKPLPPPPPPPSRLLPPARGATFLADPTCKKKNQKKKRKRKQSASEVINPPPSYPTLLLLFVTWLLAGRRSEPVSTNIERKRKERTQSEVAPSPHLTQSGLKPLPPPPPPPPLFLVYCHLLVGTTFLANPT
jgi:hypothetical protein